MNTYTIDLKVYEPAGTNEIPFVLPDKVVSESRLRTGYHSLVVQWPAEMLDSFLKWANGHGAILKVLGIQTISV